MTSSSRERILAAVRDNAPAPSPLPEVPLFDDNVTGDLWPRFCAALARMGGRLCEPEAGSDLANVCRQLFPDATVICSATHEVTAHRNPPIAGSARDLANVDVAIVRAHFGVAETGSVFLDEAALGRPALGFLAQHLIVLLDPADVIPNLHHACRRREYRDAPYGVLMTGPSATADIEGVLIHGAQGVRSLTVIRAPRS
jgi:L-lactate dehydrogenase complex protein LldG